MKQRLYLLLVVFLTVSAMANEIWYHDDFEGENRMRFLGCSEPPTSFRSVAEKRGDMIVHRAGLTVQKEHRSHGDVCSFILDITVDKNTGRWGARNYWGPKQRLDIPLDKPVWITAYVYPEKLPPGLSIQIGIAFNCPEKHIRGGVLVFPSLGVDSQGWMVFQKNVTEFLKKSNFPNSTMIGWDVAIVGAPGQAFKGQRVKFYLDDVTVSSEPEKIDLNTAGQIRYLDVKPGPHTVGYASLYADYPAGAPNRVRNSSFENGLNDWYSSVSFAGDNKESMFLPNPERSFQIRRGGAPHGNCYLEICHPDNRATRTGLSSMPISIQDGKPYTLSFYAKASEPGTVLSVNWHKVKLSADWKRYRIDLPAIQCVDRGGKKFHNRYTLNFSNTGSANVMLDAVQLEAGPLTAFQYPDLVTLSVRPQKYLGIYTSGEKPEVVATLFNGTRKKRKCRLSVDVRNFASREIKTFSREVEFSPGEGRDFTFELPDGYRHYKVAATLETEGIKRQQAVTAVSKVDDLSRLPGREFFGQLLAAGPNPPNFRNSLELNRLLGVKWVIVYNLIGLNWNPDWRAGNNSWNRIDFVLNEAGEYGFSVIPSFGNFDGKGFRKDSSGLNLFEAKDLKEIGDWCRAVAERYRGKIDHYEVFGEYISGDRAPKARNIMKVQPVAYRALKQGNPACTVVTWGENNMDAICDDLKVHMELGSLAYSDAVSLHPYRIATEDQELLLRVYPAVGALIRKYNHGKSKPVWCTEAGHRAVDTLYYDDIEPESMYYPLHCTELEQAERTVRENVIAKTAGVEHYFSFYTDPGPRFFSFSYVQEESGIRPKTVFPAYNFMVGQLAGTKPAGEVDRPENWFHCYLFERGGDPVAVLWRYAADHSALTVDFPLDPKHVEAFDLVGEPMKLASGRKLRLSVGSSPIYLKPRGISGKEFLAAMRNPGMDAVHLSLQPVSGKAVELTLKNGNRERTGVLAVTGKKTETLTLKADEIRKIQVPIGSTLEIRADWTDAKGKVSSSIGFIPVAPKGGHAVTLKPEIRYSRFPEIKYGGPADLSAGIRCFFDREAFYLEADVRDDIQAGNYSKSNHPEFLWANDALQLGFYDPDFPGLREINVSLTPEGPESFATIGGVASDRIGLNIVRKGDTTNYRVRIPWKAVWPKFTFPEEPKIRFNVAVVDNDGPSPVRTADRFIGDKQSLQLTPGITDSKAPEKFRLLLWRIK